jgi:AcrR family transcriptional regulator
VSILGTVSANRDVVEPAQDVGNDLRARRRKELRAHVEHVAVGLFQERGYESVTVDDIAAAAGVSKRTLFRHFASKDEIVLGRARDFGSAIADLDLAGMSAADALRAVEDIYAGMLRLLADDPTALEVQRVIAQSDRLRQAAHSLHRDLMDGLRVQLVESEGAPGSLTGRVVIELSTGTLHAVLDEWGRSAHDGHTAHTLSDLYDRARLTAREILR